MTDAEMVEKTAAFVKDKFARDSTGHDWWHLYRVWQLSRHIAAEEKNVDMLVVELAALLHDIADFKFHGNDFEAGPKLARQWLSGLGCDEKTIGAVEDIIRNISFKGAAEKNKLETLEGRIVHDADKLDAIGAMGISRTFAFGGAKGLAIYDPTKKPNADGSFDTYKKLDSPSINHFYEKLLLLKDRMFTETGKRMAEHRHKFMEAYLAEFYNEWEGKR